MITFSLLSCRLLCKLHAWCMLNDKKKYAYVLFVNKLFAMYAFMIMQKLKIYSFCEQYFMTCRKVDSSAITTLMVPIIYGVI